MLDYIRIYSYIVGEEGGFLISIYCNTGPYGRKKYDTLSVKIN